MIDQTVLVQDVVAQCCGIEDFVNFTGNVNDYLWYLVTSEDYTVLTRNQKAGITAFECYWIGEKLNENQNLYSHKGGDYSPT